MKIRDDVTHVDELLQVNVFDRIISVIDNCNPNKCNSDRYKQDAEALLQMSTGPPSAYHTELAKQLRSDILDIECSISVLHEMCCFHSGSVAMAHHKTCIALLADIPSDAISALATALVAKFSLFPHTAVSGEPDWGEPMLYHLGMIEQGTIDMFGRILNGLDQHMLLRKEIGKMIQRLLLVSLTMDQKEMLSAPDLDHCIKLKPSLSKLRKVLADLDSKKPKAWKLTFRIERNYFPGGIKRWYIDGETSKITYISTAPATSSLYL